MLRNEKGSATALLLLFTVIFLVISGICAEWYHAITLRNYVDEELTRALRLSMNLSIDDSYRKDHVSRALPCIGEDEFALYLRNYMGLNDSCEKFADNKLVYKICFSQINVLEETPEFDIQGVIIKAPLLFNDVGEIKIPFHIKITNTRMEVL